MTSNPIDAQVRAFFSDPARSAATAAVAPVADAVDVVHAPASDADEASIGASGVGAVASTIESRGSAADPAAAGISAQTAITATDADAVGRGGVATDTPNDDGTGASDDPTSAALFDYSSYTGGAPSLLSVATSNGTASGSSDGATASVVAASSLFGQDLDAVSRELLATAATDSGASTSMGTSTGKPGGDSDERRIGRPSHPAWEYFARGEKRNRFHHNAYCRYCAANGVDPEPIRGVSENMIRHLQKCVHCPEETVAQLKVLCAQKDAARFSKRHQTHPSDVDMLLHDAASSKRIKHSSSNHVSESVGGTSGHTSAFGAAGGVTGDRTAGDATGSHSTVDDEFMPLHLPLLPSELAGGATQNGLGLGSTISTAALTPAADVNSSSHALSTSAHARVTGIHQRARLRELPTKRGAGRASAAPLRTTTTTMAVSTSSEQHQHQQATQSSHAFAATPIDASVLNHLAVTATLSAGLPWDWMDMDESTRMIGAAAHAQLQRPPRASALQAVAATSHAKQFAKMKDDVVGVTLAINSWASKYQKTNVAVFSLVNALGEASVWELLELGLDDPASDVLADKIKHVLLALHDAGVQVINIVADSTLAYAAARFAVSSMENSSHDIPVLPCFAHFLSLLLGVVLTVSDVFADTMGDVIEIVQMFSNQRVLRALRRECGDPDASLVLPTKDRWYSFIECIDSVRQYEDMIKIIASKVLAAAAASATSSSASSTNISTSASAGGTEFFASASTAGAASSSGGGGAHAVGAAIAPGAAPRPMRKDSAGNSADELADVQLSPSVLRAILNPAFWEHVVSLSELVSPIKETHKLLAGSSSSAAQFSLSDVFYQCGRMHQQFGVILSDWEDSTCGRRTLAHVRFVQDTVNKMWKLYDQPLMVLSYILNYNLVYPHLSLTHASLQWLSIGKYAKEYFRRWFCSAPPVRGAAAPPRLALSEDTASRFLDDILAYKERKYPFDTESVCEFEHPRAFYALVSDSNPLMHLFGSRLFSLATSTPPLAEVVPGSSFVTSSATTASARDELLSVLQLKLFAHTAVRPSKELLAFLQSARAGKTTGSGGDAGDDSAESAVGMRAAAAGRGVPSSQASGKELLLDCGMDARACVTVWNKRQWTRLAREWRAHWEKETDTEELLRNLALLDPGLFRFAPNVSLDQIFKDKLPSRLPHDREEAVVDV